MGRIKNIAIAFDQFAFCLLTLGSSHPDETASSAAWRLEQKGRWTGKFFRPVIDGLFYVLARERNHCHESYRSELFRAQLPPEFRK